MAAISGKSGKVLVGSTTLAEITGWTWNRSSNNPAWASSDTAGEKTRVGGIKDSSGSFDFKYDTADEIQDTITEGTGYTLKLYLNASLFVTVPAIIDQIRLETDINEGEVVGGSCDFSQTGAPTWP